MHLSPKPNHRRDANLGIWCQSRGICTPTIHPDQTAMLIKYLFQVWSSDETIKSVIIKKEKADLLKYRCIVSDKSIDQRS